MSLKSKQSDEEDALVPAGEHRATRQHALGNGDFDQKALIRQLSVAILANCFEYYDFALLGYFTTQIGSSLFPSTNDSTYAVETYSLYCVGFLSRPFGGAFFGFVGDKLGRKIALRMALIGMGLSTFLTGCIPPFSTIGWGAPIILLILRLIQGLSVGGENSSAETFAFEIMPEGQRGKWMSVYALSSLSVLFAALTHVILEAACTADQLLDWGWRIPFLLGIFVLFLAQWIRKGLHSTHDFEVMQEHASFFVDHQGVIDNPLTYAWQHHKPALLYLLGSGAMQHGVYYALFTFLPDYLSDSEMHGWSDEWSYTYTCINLLLSVPVLIGTGYHVDKWGAKPFMVLSSVLTMLVTPIAYYFLAISNSVAINWIIQLVLACIYQVLNGSIHYWYLNSLVTDPRTRVSVFGVGYNVSSALFSGTAALIGAAFVDALGSVDGMLAAGFWSSFLALLTLVTSWHKENHDTVHRSFIVDNELDDETATELEPLI